MFVVCCVGSGVCDGLIATTEGAYRLCVCLIVCDLEPLTMRWPRLELGCCATERKIEAVAYLEVVGNEAMDILKLCIFATVCNNSVLFV